MSSLASTARHQAESSDCYKSGVRVFLDRTGNWYAEAVHPFKANKVKHFFIASALEYSEHLETKALAHARQQIRRWRLKHRTLKQPTL